MLSIKMDAQKNVYFESLDLFCYGGYNTIIKSNKVFGKHFNAKSADGLKMWPPDITWYIVRVVGLPEQYPSLQFLSCSLVSHGPRLKCALLKKETKILNRSQCYLFMPSMGTIRQYTYV